MKPIILLNGPSSSGKSTISKCLKSLLKEQYDLDYMIVSIDDFMKIREDEKIYEDDVFEISNDMCNKTVELISQGYGVIIDHVITSKRIFDELIDSIKDYPLYKVEVTCPIDVLLSREKARGNRHLGSANDSYDYLYPKQGYDLVIDTSKNNEKETSLHIINKIKTA